MVLADLGFHHLFASVRNMETERDYKSSDDVVSKLLTKTFTPTHLSFAEEMMTDKHTRNDYVGQGSNIDFTEYNGSHETVDQLLTHSVCVCFVDLEKAYETGVRHGRPSS